LISVPAFADVPSVDAPYEVKVNLDPVTAQAAFPTLVAGVTVKSRPNTFFLINPTPHSDRTIVRARRDQKNKTDITVKLRGIRQVMAWLLTGPQLGLEGVECEWDVGFADEGKLSCDIKVETSNDTSPLDGASVMARLNESQLRLLEIGTHQPDFHTTLTACPAVPAQVWKEIAAVDGCDEATVEIWQFADGPLYELSCNTTTLEAARAGLQARMDSLGIAASPDQTGKTARALAQCAPAE
jgi:hypothetical protein